jgi:hypothetical protein
MICSQHSVCWLSSSNSLSFGHSIYIDHPRLRPSMQRYYPAQQQYGTSMLHPSCSCPSSILIYAFFPFSRLARGSILASVIRIMPGGLLRIAALYVSGLFVVLFAVCIAQVVWVCEMELKLNSTGAPGMCPSLNLHSNARYYERSSSSIPDCSFAKQVAILQTTGDSNVPPLISSYSTLYEAAMISDALLIFFPLRTLRQLKNHPGLRRRLQFTFAASAVTTCASINSGVFNWKRIQFGYQVAVLIEVHHLLPALSALPSNSSPSPSAAQCHFADLLHYSSTFEDLALPHSLQFRCPRQRLLQIHKQIRQYRTRRDNILFSR